MNEEDCSCSENASRYLLWPIRSSGERVPMPLTRIVTSVTICFLFAYDEKEPKLSPETMRQFLQSPLFASRTTPATR